MRQHLTPTIAATMVLLAACQSTPERHAQLEEARRVFQDASANPDVLQSAQLELERARSALYRAEHAWKERSDEQETSHLAYLAKQQAHVALNIGMQHAADNMVTAAGVERERAIAQASTQQAQQARKDAEQARGDAQALALELQALQGKQTERGMVVVLQDVLFDVGQADLKPGASNRLEKLAAVLRKHPERQLQIEGYTDSTGSAAFNQTLSEQRADAVKRALTALGIGADRIQTQGFGEARPVAGNDTAAGRQQNRRVEIVFSDEQGTFASP